MKLDKIYKKGKLSIGLEIPLDNDWSISGEIKRKFDGRPFGVPDITEHATYAKLADTLGFKALWVRDVPVYDPAFGDAAQQFEIFTYLGYLAGITEHIMLGTAAVVLPLREPILVAKSSASVDVLSDGRLLLGLGLGDRPVEFPLFGYEFENRSERFRNGVAVLRHSWKKDGLLNDIYKGVPPEIQVFPKPAQENIPLVMAGFGQQSLEWIAKNMDAWFNYPRPVETSKTLVDQWKKATDRLEIDPKPFITGFQVDLLEDVNAEMTPHKFGGKIGRNRLIDLLHQYREAGVAHMALHLRQTQRPIAEAMNEIAEYILPEFHD